MSYILNIETATAICSVALAKNGVVTAFRETTEPNSHSLKLGSFVKDVLSDAGISPSQLNAVAVSSGPGSYTGLRIGVSMAKGLAYSLDIPLIAVPTLKAMANGVREKHTDAGFLVPMIDARRMEVYAAVFSSSLDEVEKVKPVIIDEKSFDFLLKKNKVVFFGDGAAKCKGVISSPNAVFEDEGFPSAKAMAAISQISFDEKSFEDTAYFEPFYLKEFQAKISMVKGLR